MISITYTPSNGRLNAKSKLFKNAHEGGGGNSPRMTSEKIVKYIFEIKMHNFERTSFFQNLKYPLK
jgi:hypothetical protein